MAMATHNKPVRLNTKNIKKWVHNINGFIDTIQCANYSTQLPPARKIVAIGDVHGDFEALMYCLFGAQVINEGGQWIGRDTVVVFTGDIIDDCREDDTQPSGCFNDFPVNGDDELVILGYLADLNQQAIRTGGKVILCLGNHEFMAITGNKYSDKYIQQATRSFYHNNRYHYFQPGSPLARKIACLMNVVVFIGDWVFLHGGLRPSAFENMDDIGTTNATMRAYIEGSLTPWDAKRFMNEIDNNWFIWDRAYSQNMVEEEGGRLCSEFIQMRQMLGKPHLRMVVGHSPQHVINSICSIDGKPAIYRIDTSMSRAFGPKSHPSQRIHALVIRGDNISAITPMAFGREFSVPHSQAYYDEAVRRKQYISKPKEYKPVIPKSDKRAVDYRRRQTYLEEHESTRLDDAFIYDGDQSL